MLLSKGNLAWKDGRELVTRCAETHGQRFTNSLHRDRFFALADRIKTSTTGMITIEPDDAVIRMTKAKDANKSSSGFTVARPQVPKLEILRLGECHFV